MARTVYLGLRSFLNNLENLLSLGFRGQPPTQLAVTGFPSFELNAPRTAADSEKSGKFSLKELIGNGILWAVPKHRRTIEKRLNRKFGLPEYNWKPLTVKTNLRNCNQCGHDHELGVLCPHCYKKVEQETRLMQDKIQEKLGLEPVEHEVVVLYEGEKFDKYTANSAGEKNVRIVEMQKPRPVWFSKNLLQKTTAQPADTKEVKPVNLG